MAPSDDDGSDRPVVLFDETEDGLGAAEEVDAEDLGFDPVPLSAEEAAVHVVDPAADE